MNVIKLLAMAAGVSLAVPASAASTSLINVQFAGNFTYNCPPFGGACTYSSPVQTGGAVVGGAGDQWNYNNSASGYVGDLKTSDGSSSGVSMSFNSALAYSIGTASNGMAGTAQANLFGGYLDGNWDTPVSISLSGLAANSAFDMYVFSSQDYFGSDRGMLVDANGASASLWQQPGLSALVEGGNYIHLAGMTDGAGNLQITAYTLNGEADLNGFQLVASTTMPVGGIPEGATWALLIVGLGATGGTMRRRNASALRTRASLTFA